MCRWNEFKYLLLVLLLSSGLATASTASSPVDSSHLEFVVFSQFPPSKIHDGGYDFEFSGKTENDDGTTTFTYKNGDAAYTVTVDSKGAIVSKGANLGNSGSLNYLPPSPSAPIDSKSLKTLNFSQYRPDRIHDGNYDFNYKVTIRNADGTQSHMYKNGDATLKITVDGSGKLIEKIRRMGDVADPGYLPPTSTSKADSRHLDAFDFAMSPPGVIHDGDYDFTFSDKTQNPDGSITYNYKNGDLWYRVVTNSGGKVLSKRSSLDEPPPRKAK